SRTSGYRRDRLSLERRQVDAVGAPVLRLDERDVRVARVDAGVESVAAADVEAVAVRDARTVPGGARHAPMAVVLQAAANEEWILHVGADLVELADRQVVPEEPALAAIPRNRDASVAADDQMIRIIGIDPQGMILGMHGAEHVAEIPPAVVRHVEAAVRSKQV